jgi:hypothetical protein
MAIEGTKAFDGFTAFGKQQAAIREDAIHIEERYANALCAQ